MKIYDELTGLYDKQGFYARVEELLRMDENERFFILRLDIRNFKLVNSMFGIQVGDMLLIEIGQTLRQNQFPKQVSCRLEGDQYCVLICEQYKKKLINTLLHKDFYVGGDKAYPIYINMGIYEIQDRSIPVSIMCDKAGMALDTIKDNRLEKVAVYQENMYRDILMEHELSFQLPTAIAQQQLQIYLQPQVNRKGRVHGAEALVRWKHPDKGLLLPGQFLPMFEENHMISDVDQYVWEMACKQLHKWNQEGKDGMYLSVNISPRDFEAFDVYKTLTSLVAAYKIATKQLRLEITETAIMQNTKEQIQLIEKLRNAGFQVEMDDFGTGYSSLSMLKDIQIDALKLDMRFLNINMQNERGRKILKVIAELAKDLDIRLIAEGVENKKQLEFLLDIGCDVFQGFYFAKPMETEVFEHKYCKDGKEKHKKKRKGRKGNVRVQSGV